VSIAEQAGLTVIRLGHVSEVRMALNDARTALGLTPVSFTDGTLFSGASVGRLVHIQPLRDGL